VENALCGHLAMGPLDGALHLVTIIHALTEGGISTQQDSFAAGIVSFLVATKDPQAVLSTLGPKGLLRLLDLLHYFREITEPSQAALHLYLAMLWALQKSGVLACDDEKQPHAFLAFRVATDLTLWAFSILSQRQSLPGTAELYMDFQSYRTLPALVQFVSNLMPSLSTCRWQDGKDEAWWCTLSSCMQLLSSLILHHNSLAHEFVQENGLQLLAARKLLSPEMAAVDSKYAHQIVVDSLLIVSQLARTSKDYYPSLEELKICGNLQGLLACSSANIRTKACNAIGNMVRYSDAFYDSFCKAEILPQLIALCADEDSACRKFASFALGNSAFHSDALYAELAPAIPQLLRLLEDEDEKTRANAAGAIGNLVRNSSELCSMMVQEGALQSLYNLVNSRRPRTNDDCAQSSCTLERFIADSSVKIALFSLGNLAVHSECRHELQASIGAMYLCRALMGLCRPEDTIYKYAQRLLQKLTSPGVLPLQSTK